MLLFAPDKTNTGITASVYPPTEYIIIKNSAKRGRGYFHINLKDTETKNILEFSGSVSKPGSEIVSIINPPVYTATVFSEMLKRWGIIFTGSITTGAVPDTTVSLYKHYSRDLSEIITDMNRYSNNFVAEQILKTMGAEFLQPPGTAQKGIHIILRSLKKLGCDLEHINIVDGSGLSPENRISSSLLSMVLSKIFTDYRYSYDYIHSLPVGGVNGTLKNRLKVFEDERRIRAKSGRIARTSALSGYLFPQKSETPLAFSILVNNYRCSTSQVMQLQEKFLEVLLLNHSKIKRNE